MNNNNKAETVKKQSVFWGKDDNARFTSMKYTYIIIGDLHISNFQKTYKKNYQI